MERVIYNCSATPVTPQQRTMGQARRYEGELDARKPARPVRWRGKALSSLDDMLIPLSFKWNRQCAYCRKKDVPLQIEHIHPRAKGGSNRISNLCLACEKCNRAKGTQDVAVFLKKEPDVLKRIQAQVKHPLKDAATVNTTRWLRFV
ncbi:hypothetical protein KDI_55430 [Dictyobacter arantiisoli]|uniref:HNH nuclease domain-containing protein n=1 Tax=Dictyobacter arantiisoli TaxID=2014874 RepID=A0A5A5TLF6_9CHLR|nr:hypothetical protein KDI_55430 [Dictyobacter arantiisoli]